MFIQSYISYVLAQYCKIGLWRRRTAFFRFLISLGATVVVFVGIGTALTSALEKDHGKFEGRTLRPNKKEMMVV